jgi:hypothetical protein
MTIYKATRDLVHKESGERIESGTFLSDDGTYNLEDGLQTISTGEAVINVSPAPPPILWRPSFLAGRSQADINYLIGYVLEVVDHIHDDYAKLVEFGVIKIKKTTKPSKTKTVEGTDD